MNLSVRLALPDDEAPILNLLREMHTEESIEPVDDDKVSRLLRKLIYREGGVIGVIRGKDRIEGTIGLELTCLWYSSALHLNKIWLFVHGAHRKSTHAKSMLEFSKAYADMVGVPLMADEVCGPNNIKKVELVSRQLPEVGKFYLYNRREIHAVAPAA